jgi:hypothetical protein
MLIIWSLYIMDGPLTVLRRFFTPSTENLSPPGTFSFENPPRPELNSIGDTLSPMQPEPIQVGPLFPRISQWFDNLKTSFQNMFANFIARFRTSSEPQKMDTLLAENEFSDEDDGFVLTGSEAKVDDELSDEDDIVVANEQGNVQEVGLATKIQQNSVANITLVSEIWDELQQPGFAMFPGLLLGASNLDMIQAVGRSTESVVFLPAVIENRGLGASFLPEHLRQHFVVFVVNKDTGAVGYFDPQGKEISKEERSLLHNDKTPQEFVQELRDELKLQGATNSNLQKIQKNSTECGFYGSLFMGHMASGVSFAHLTGSNSRHEYFGGNDGVKNALMDAIDS